MTTRPLLHTSLSGLVAVVLELVILPLAGTAAIVQQAYLKASNPGADDQFGFPVAVSGDTLIVGARQEASNATGVNGDPHNDAAQYAGAAYVFVRRGTNWTQQAYLKGSNTEAHDRFGVSAAVSGDTIAVGAQAESSNVRGVNGNQSDNSAPRSGAAYVFVRRGTNWFQQAYLKASNAGSNHYFGRAIALADDTIVVGAPGEDSPATGVNSHSDEHSATSAGAAYVFVRRGTNWTQQAYLKASNTGARDRFGYTVSVSGDTVVVGADGEDSHATGVNGRQNDESATNSGAAYVFVRRGTNWTQQAYVKAATVRAGAGFGVRVAVSIDTAVVGGGGAAVFVRRGTTWRQQAALIADGAGPDDNYGDAVAVAGDIAVIGAYGDDRNAAGINAQPTGQAATNSGAAYVFTRRGTNWTRQAYLKAANAGTGDYFGGSVAVAGDTVVVGAGIESSTSAGVDDHQSDHRSTHSGAAYVFTGLSMKNPSRPPAGR